MNECKIVSFYSFKGGSGRSLTLTNTAVELARRGKRVACIDMDVEAPGLGEIFQITDRATTGTARLLKDLDPLALQECLVDASKQYQIDSPGCLLVIPALTSEHHILGQIFWDKSRLEAFYENVLVDLIGIKNLDYVLIDSRSGIAEEAIMALLLSNSYIVLALRLDRQSRDGAAFIARELPGLLGDKAKWIFVANFVPPIAEADRAIKEFEEASGRRLDVRVPFEASLLLQEQIITQNNSASLVAAGYREVADLLSQD